MVSDDGLSHHDDLPHQVLFMLAAEQLAVHNAPPPLAITTTNAAAAAAAARVSGRSSATGAVAPGLAGAPGAGQSAVLSNAPEEVVASLLLSPYLQPAAAAA